MNGEKRRLGPSVDATFASTVAVSSVRVSSAVGARLQFLERAHSSGGSARSMRSHSDASSRNSIA